VLCRGVGVAYRADEMRIACSRLTAFTVVAGFALAALTSLDGEAAAQTLPSIDARTWSPSTDPTAGLVLEPTATPGPWQWSFGGILSYAHHPVTLRRAGSDEVASRPLEHMLGADFIANVGIGQRAAVGLSIPMALYQDGTGGLPTTIVSSDSVPSSALGDVGIHGKATILSNVKDEVSAGFGLAALGMFTVPTGERASFLSNGSSTASVRLLAEYTLIVATVQGSLGYRLRTSQQTWPDASLGGTTFGDEIPWSLGVSLRPFGPLQFLDHGSRQTWEIAAHGWLPAGPVAPFSSGASRLSPVLLGVSDRISLGHYRDVYALVGVDIGLDTAVGVPAFRGVLGAGWAPRDHDRDHDGVPDDIDQCADLAEDLDGIDDHDGCPEDDADDDGVPDHLDVCPHVKGVWWNDPRKNGCPAPDTDGDTVPDPLDACVNVKGVPTDDPKTNGCPPVSMDRDKDGVADDADKCPDQPEDTDGFEDADGCPDPDNDGDGITDKVDACPNTKGEPSSDPKKNGCPNPDRDGDTFLNEADKCPDEAEVFNGVKDDDGCPDEGGKLLVAIDAVTKPTLKTLRPIKVSGTALLPEIDKESVDTLRAIVLELNRHRSWTLFVGVRPGAGATDAAQRAAIDRAAAISKAVDDLALREDASEAVGWDAVRQQPGSESGVGLLIVVAPVARATP
jgi:OOP family OmpA-OmpF porin